MVELLTSGLKERISTILYASPILSFWNPKTDHKKGSHKINNALGQILLARRLGKTRIIAETGAGQHGVATATVCAKFNMDCTIYMGAVSK